MFENIRADLQRKRDLYHAYHGWVDRYIRNVIDLGALSVIVYRFGHWVVHLKIPVLRPILLFFYLIAKAAVIICAGIYIPARAKIGKGFVIHNFSGIFISEGVIGINCTVQQGVTIGGIRPNIWKGKPKPPQIADGVYIGAGAKILGDVSIGNNAVIGTNSVVMTDVPDNCTVMGVPARIVSRDKERSQPYGTVQESA
jgi:serine O-acetyltransferase